MFNNVLPSLRTFRK